MFDWLTVSELTSLLSVIAIDVALAGDNAVVVGMAAAGLPGHRRRHVIIIGILAATTLRILFAIFATRLLEIVGLLLAGGLLLLWVSWKLWRELREQSPDRAAATSPAGDGSEGAKARPKTFKEAVVQIVLADVSMSLDNVLAVAGAAREHIWVLIIGLSLSVALMGFAATLVARLLNRYRWIAYVGLLVIVYVALRMIWDGSYEVLEFL